MPVFVLGSGRSGTTLLRVMLAGHPRLWSPPEMFIANFETMRERAAYLDRRYWLKGGLRRAIMDLLAVDVEEARRVEDGMADWTIPQVYAWLQERLGDRILVDKNPALAAESHALPKLERWFPDARYLWIVRHPGSVIRSFENMPMAEVMLQGYDVAPKDLWFRANTALASFLGTVPPERWAMLRYEDLVTDPRPVMERALAAIGLPFHEAVLDPYEGDRMREGPKGARAIGDPNLAGRKRIEPELATKWLEGFDPRGVGPETHALAAELGYDLGALSLPPIARVGDAMARLFATAREIEGTLAVPSDLDAVEGRRFLLRQLSAALDTHVEQLDVDRPTFAHAEGPTRKMFADNPDTDYLRAPIELGPGRVYRLRGRIPAGALYVGVLLYGKGGRIARRLVDRELKPDADGRFEVLVSTEPQAGVWLEGDGDERGLMVRQYFTDRATEPRVTLELELVSPAARPPELSAEPLADALDRARRQLLAVFGRTVKAYDMARTAALNNFIEIPGEALFPTPDNRYRIAWYRFGPDQVMLVRGQLPKCRYFGIQLCNAWMESLDYERARAHLNHRTLVTDADGRFEICLAHRDVGHPNWIDTTGHHAGYAIVRALLPEGELPQLEVQVRYESELAQRP